jgi:hypothetical protein
MQLLSSPRKPAVEQESESASRKLHESIQGILAAGTLKVSIILAKNIKSLSNLGWGGEK